MGKDTLPTPAEAQAAAKKLTKKKGKSWAKKIPATTSKVSSNLVAPLIRGLHEGMKGKPLKVTTSQEINQRK